ncbi:hypothetical protein DPEC_G00243640 [Dallia pectoralis]|uniref:Uncharacterized protein n=1 Tax=Dallia pectoralis TaxID=75939 RepID=A0ACC2FV87_DALPE|nr:hypothetical protein DPEC_G00243640 [Dallia pectoralis]
MGYALRRAVSFTSSYHFSYFPISFLLSRLILPLFTNLLSIPPFFVPSVMFLGCTWLCPDQPPSLSPTPITMVPLSTSLTASH